MHMKIGFCDHYRVQMTILIPDAVGECSLEREHAFLTEMCFTYAQLFRPVKSPLRKYVNVTQKIKTFCQV